MKKYDVIASGSDGNAVLYHKSILVDCGVSFSSIQPYLYQLQLILLTHEHRDHINIETLRRICGARPTVRVGCCDWMLPHLDKIRNVDVYEIGVEYNYRAFSLMPLKLYHDVPQCGYRIFKDGYRLIHCTDTQHLNGITAPG